MVAKNTLGRQIHNVVVKVGEHVGNVNGDAPSQALGELSFKVKSDIPPNAIPATPGMLFTPKPAATPKTRKYGSFEPVKLEPVKQEQPSDTNSETEARVFRTNLIMTI